MGPWLAVCLGACVAGIVVEMLQLSAFLQRLLQQVALILPLLHVAHLHWFWG